MSSPLELLSLSALVHVDVLMRWAIAEGKTLEQVAKDVSLHLQKRSGSIVSDPIAQPRQRTATCPSCIDGQLFLCRQTSAMVGAPVLVCSKHCGYSHVAGVVK